MLSRPRRLLVMLLLLFTIVLAKEEKIWAYDHQKTRRGKQWSKKSEVRHLNEIYACIDAVFSVLLESVDLVAWSQDIKNFSFELKKKSKKQKVSRKIGRSPEKPAESVAGKKRGCWWNLVVTGLLVGRGGLCAGNKLWN